MDTKRTAIASCAMVVIALLSALPTYADCGSIPYTPIRMAPIWEGAEGFLFNKMPDGSKRVEFDPLDVVVYEPGQRAIILWNGVEEILLLSTEISTNQPTSILEVIPMPNEPQVSLGKFETFEKMQALLIKKQMWTVASGGGVQGVQLPEGVAHITFHDVMGAHDINVVHVVDTARFSDWVMAFMRSKEAVNPAIDPRFLNVIQNYIDRGFRWFVFDSIDTTDKVQSREPIQYRFITNELFYPLEISSLEVGRTNVELLLITPQPLTQLPKLRPAARFSDAVTISKVELENAAPEWASFIAESNMQMQPVRIRGKLKNMEQDFLAR